MRNYQYYRVILATLGIGGTFIFTSPIVFITVAIGGYWVGGGVYLSLKYMVI